MLGLATIAALALAVPSSTVNQAPCPTDMWPTPTACYVESTDQIYIRPDVTGRTRWFWIEHERGHAMDAKHLDDGERRAFSCLPAARTPYYGDPKRCGGSWKTELIELFADAYANCRLGNVPGQERFETANGYEPTTRRRHENACRFIVRALAD